MISETTLEDVRPTRAVNPSRSPWRSVGALRGLVTFLIAMNGLYLLFVAFGNITDFPANQAFVQHVLAMDTTNFGAPAGTHSIRGSCGARSPTRPAERRLHRPHRLGDRGRAGVGYRRGLAPAWP
jgi:hypothetical protein